MKFFNWMQNKFNGGQCIRKLDVSVHASYHGRRESDGGLLTIGTFGNQQVPENHQDSRRLVENPAIQEEKGISLLSPDLTEFTPDEFGKLQKELTKLLKRKPKAAESAAVANDLQPLDRFLNCPSSLSTMDRTRYNTNLSIIISNDHHIIEEEDDDDIDRTIRIIIGRCKEVSKNKGNIGKKSVSFLLKKLFLCSSGQFAPPHPPGLRDTMQESRMEKLLRTLMLSKKMYPPQNALSTKSILESRYSWKEEEKQDDNEKLEKRAESRKWVKTDSEYIVLDLD